MDRNKATHVLTEILNSWKKETPIQGYSINNMHSNDYELRLITEADKECLDCVAPIIKKFDLAMKEAQGYLIIYSP